MLEIRNQGKVQEFLNSTLTSTDICTEAKTRASELLELPSVPWRQLEALCTQVRSSTGSSSGPWLHQLCSGSFLQVDPPKPRMKSPQLLERLAKLQKEQDQRVYDKMVQGVIREERSAAQGFSILPTFKLQMSFAVQVLLSMAVFFIMGEMLGRTLTDKPVWRALTGVLGLTFGLLLEAFLWMVRSKEGKVPKALLKKRKPGTYGSSNPSTPAAEKKNS